MKNRRQVIGYKRQDWTIDGPGISFIMGSWALNWAYEKGSRNAELLAVEDDAMMSKILVRLYQRLVYIVNLISTISNIYINAIQSFGFEIVKYVGEDIGSVPDRLLWGAVGTLMRLDTTKFFDEWTPKFQVLFENMQDKHQQQQQQQQQQQ